jgi:hypothetical protein
MSHHKDYGIWPLHPQKHAHRLFFLFSPCKKTQHWKRSSLLNQISHREDSHSTSKTIKNNPISAHNHQILYIVIPLCKWPLMSVHHCTNEWHHYKNPMQNQIWQLLLSWSSWLQSRTRSVSDECIFIWFRVFVFIESPKRTL